MLPHAHRLRRNADIRHVRRVGQRRSHPLLLLFAVENGQLPARFAISVSKHIGGAVVRNRVKRRIREAIRRQLDNVQPGRDFLFVVRDGAPHASFLELETAVTDLLSRMGALQVQAS